MLDQGFEGDIRFVEENYLPPKTERQTLMFSATFKDDVQSLAKEFLNDYIFITVGIIGGANEDINQSIIEVAQREKKDKLMEILTQEELISDNPEKSKGEMGHES